MILKNARILIFITLATWGYWVVAQTEIELDSHGVVLPRFSALDAGDPQPGKIFFDTTTQNLVLGDSRHWKFLTNPFFTQGTTIIAEDTDNSLLFGLATIPISGLPQDGNTMMYYQFKGAFRGGALENSAAYDIDSLGDHSFGYGKNVLVKGRGAVSFGLDNIAEANYSSVLGTHNEVRTSAAVSFALGTQNLVVGSQGSGTLGNDCTVLGSSGALAMGYESTTSGSSGSFSIGRNVTTEGNSGALSLGLNNITYADSGASALGYDLLNVYNHSLVVGKFNDPLGSIGANALTGKSPIFMVGNGDASDDRSNALVLLKKGWAGFGTNEPEARLHIEANSTQDHPHLILKESNNVDPGRMQFHNTNSDSNFWAMAARPRNNALNSSAYMNFYYSGLGQNVLRLTGDGDAEFAGDVTASCGVLTCSDARYKKDLNGLGSVLKKIKEIDGLYYYWKKDEFPERSFDADRQIGILAQNIEHHFPELVHTNADGYKSVAYDRLGPILLEGIKEQQSLIDDLTAQNIKLEESMIQLEKEQEVLMQKVEHLAKEIRLLSPSK